MSGLRLTVSAVLGAAGIVLAMVSPAVAASAAPNISILSAGPDASGDPYDLTVVANDGNGLPILTMTAYVSNAAGPVGPPVPMTAQSVSDPADQTWAATNPITGSALPQGTYTVQVAVTDADESDTLSAPGSFTVTYLTDNLTVTASPSAVTQGSQTVNFSGTLTGTAQGGSPVGIANVPVNVSGGISGTVPTTDSNGNFSFVATGVQPGSYTFGVAAVPGAYPAAGDTVSVSAQAATTSMTVSASPASVTQGEQSVTFSGTVSVTPPMPAPQTPVGIGSGIPVYLDGSQVTQTTDANGDFSYAASGVAPGNYTFSVNPSPLGLYGSSAATTGVSAVAAPTKITVTPSPAVVTFGSPNVNLTGTVTAIPQGGAAVPVAGVPVYLNGSTTAFATTDSSGHFPYSAGFTQDATETFSVNSPGSGLYSGSTDAVPVNVDPGTTAMTVTASPPDINLATSKVTFTGTVSVTPFGATTSQGVGSGVPVYLAIGTGSPQQVTTTDDASGDFTYTAHGVTKPADYVFSVNIAPLYTAATDSVPIGQNQVQSTLAVTQTPASVTEGSQSVTFAGTLTGVSPGGTTAVPIQNAPVKVSINDATPKPVGTTDVNGDFTYKVSGVSQKTAYAFSVASSGTFTQATENVAVVVDQARTRISHIRVIPAHLKYGQNATLRATVQYLSGKTWVALPRTAVHLDEGKTRLRAVSSARNGTFSATLPSTHGPGWTATVGAGRLTLQTSAMGNLSIALPLTVKSFTARLAVNGKISAIGCLEVIATAGSGPGTSVDIQYATAARGPWKSLGTLPLHNRTAKSRSCRSADESYFSGGLRAKLTNAYYRADFAATYGFQSATSKVVHAWKYQTRVVTFSVSPRHISGTGVVTIRGRFEARVKSWRPWGGQRISIIANDKGSSFWYDLGTATTNSHGDFSLQAGAKPGNYVAIAYAVYAGDATHLACQSVGIDVKVSDNSSDAAPSPASPSPGLALAQVSRLQALQALEVPEVPTFSSSPSIASLARSKS